MGKFPANDNFIANGLPTTDQTTGLDTVSIAGGFLPNENSVPNLKTILSGDTPKSILDKGTHDTKPSVLDNAISELLPPPLPTNAKLPPVNLVDQPLVLPIVHDTTPTPDVLPLSLEPLASENPTVKPVSIPSTTKSTLSIDSKPAGNSENNVSVPLVAQTNTENTNLNTTGNVVTMKQILLPVPSVGNTTTESSNETSTAVNVIHQASTTSDMQNKSNNVALNSIQTIQARINAEVSSNPPSGPKPIELVSEKDNMNQIVNSQVIDMKQDNTNNINALIDLPTITQNSLIDKTSNQFLGNNIVSLKESLTHTPNSSDFVPLPVPDILLDKSALNAKKKKPTFTSQLDTNSPFLAFTNPSTPWESWLQNSILNKNEDKTVDSTVAQAIQSTIENIKQLGLTTGADNGISANKNLKTSVGNTKTLSKESNVITPPVLSASIDISPKVEKTNTQEQVQISQLNNLAASDNSKVTLPTNPVVAAGTIPQVNAAGTFTQVNTAGMLPLGNTAGTSPKINTAGTLPQVNTAGIGALPLVNAAGSLPQLNTAGTLPLVSATGTLPQVNPEGTLPEVNNIGVQQTPITSPTILNSIQNMNLDNGAATQSSDNFAVHRRLMLPASRLGEALQLLQEGTSSGVTGNAQLQNQFIIDEIKAVGDNDAAAQSFFVFRPYYLNGGNANDIISSLSNIVSTLNGQAVPSQGAAPTIDGASQDQVSPGIFAQSTNTVGVPVNFETGISATPLALSPNLVDPTTNSVNLNTGIQPFPNTVQQIPDAITDTSPSGNVELINPISNSINTNANVQISNDILSNLMSGPSSSSLLSDVPINSNVLTSDPNNILGLSQPLIPSNALGNNNVLTPNSVLGFGQTQNPGLLGSQQLTPLNTLADTTATQTGGLSLGGQSNTNQPELPNTPKLIRLSSNQLNSIKSGSSVSILDSPNALQDNSFSSAATPNGDSGIISSSSNSILLGDIGRTQTTNGAFNLPFMNHIPGSINADTPPMNSQQDTNDGSFSTHIDGNALGTNSIISQNTESSILSNNIQQTIGNRFGFDFSANNGEINREAISVISPDISLSQNSVGQTNNAFQSNSLESSITNNRNSQDSNSRMSNLQNDQSFTSLNSRLSTNNINNQEERRNIGSSTNTQTQSDTSNNVQLPSPTEGTPPLLHGLESLLANVPDNQIAVINLDDNFNVASVDRLNSVDELNFNQNRIFNPNRFNSNTANIQNTNRLRNQAVSSSDATSSSNIGSNTSPRGVRNSPNVNDQIVSSADASARENIISTSPDRINPMEFSFGTSSDLNNIVQTEAQRNSANARETTSSRQTPNRRERNRNSEGENRERTISNQRTKENTRTRNNRVRIAPDENIRNTPDQIWENTRRSNRIRTNNNRHIGVGNNENLNIGIPFRDVKNRRIRNRHVEEMRRRHNRNRNTRREDRNRDTRRNRNQDSRISENRNRDNTARNERNRHNRTRDNRNRDNRENRRGQRNRNDRFRDNRRPNNARRNDRNREWLNDNRNRGRPNENNRNDRNRNRETSNTNRNRETSNTNRNRETPNNNRNRGIRPRRLFRTWEERGNFVQTMRRILLDNARELRSRIQT